MKLPLIAAAFVASSLAAAQTFDYKVFIKGKPAGNVKSTFSEGKTGYVEESNGTLTQDGQTIKLATRTELDASYNWRSKTMEATANGRTAKAVAVPKGNGAHVTINAGGKKIERDVPKPSKITTVDATAGWFRTRTPKLNETYRYQRFEMQRMTWVDVTYKYVGPRTVKLGGASRSGFAMERVEEGKKSILIVDKKGIPIMLDSEDMRMERIYK